MSRSSKKPGGSPVSLFPFLAVLLCTMGALVILLVAMSHAARHRTLDEPAETLAAGEAITDEERARREQLLTQAKAAEEEFREKAGAVGKVLREDQLRLSQIEDHIRRMLSEIESKRAAIAQLIADETEKLDDHAQAERNLAQLNELIDEAKQEIDEIKQENAGKKKAFAIVPFRGPNGTRRRPIYVECLADRVVFQPEGVELQASDFAPPLGVGSPLASALRATREHYARETPEAGYDPDAEPYPLVIVRPEGITMYRLVRRALRSWDSDFGYEMVGADVQLAFPEPSATLSHTQQTAAKHSRIRRQALAKKAPRAYSRPSGVFVPNGDRQAERAGAAYDGPPSDQPGLSAQEPVDGQERDLFAMSDNAHDGDNQGDNNQIAKAGLYADGSSGSGKANGDGAMQPDAPKGPGANSKATGGNAGQDNPPPGAATLTSVELNPTAKKDWALEKRSPSDIALRRSVGVVVKANQLVVMNGDYAPQPGRPARGEVILLNGPTKAGVGPFVNAMRKRVRSWGMAGQGMYWRPVVTLYVAPDGVGRAGDLARLLRGSGMDIKQKRTTDLQQATALPATGGSNATR